MNYETVQNLYHREKKKNEELARLLKEKDHLFERLKGRSLLEKEAHKTQALEAKCKQLQLKNEELATLIVSHTGVEHSLRRELEIQRMIASLGAKDPQLMQYAQNEIVRQELEAKCEELSEKNNHVSNRNRQLAVDAESLLKKNERLQKVSDTLRNQNQILVTNFNALKAENEKISATFDKRLSQAHQISSDLQEANKEIVSLREELVQLREEKISLSKRVEEMKFEADLARRTWAEGQKMLDSTNSRVEALENELVNMKNVRENDCHGSQQNLRQIASLLEENQSLLQQCDVLRKEIARLERQHIETVNFLEERSSLTAENEKLAAELHKLIETHREVTNRFHQTIEEKRALEKEKELLRSEIRRSEQQVTVLSMELGKQVRNLTEALIAEQNTNKELRLQLAESQERETAAAIFSDHHRTLSKDLRTITSRKLTKLSQYGL